MSTSYNYRNCQSLFGYAFDVHIRSSGTCQLCGCGGQELTFDLWRQLTVEHIIGKKQGGYLKSIRLIVQERFPELTTDDRESLAQSIHAVNTVTACSFCNSTTSHNFSDKSMIDLIRQSYGTPQEVVAQIDSAVQPILEQKRAEVRWKLESVRREFVSRFLGVVATHDSSN